MLNSNKLQVNDKPRRSSQFNEKNKQALDGINNMSKHIKEVSVWNIYYLNRKILIILRINLKNKKLAESKEVKLDEDDYYKPPLGIKISTLENSNKAQDSEKCTYATSQYNKM